MALAGVALVVAAPSSSADLNAAGTKAAPYKYFVLPKFIGIPVFAQTNDGAKRAAKELGDSVVYNGPTTPSAQEQVTFINNAAQQGVNAIIVSANDANALAPALKKAAKQGIKTLAFDSDVAVAARSVFISGPSPAVLAQTMVDKIGKQIGYAGEVAFLSTSPTATNQNSWIAATRKILAQAKYSKMKVVTTIYGQENDAVGTTETRALLQKYPKLRGIFSYTSIGGAAARVLESEGKCKQVVLFSLAAPSALKAGLQSGCIKEGMIWSFYDLGYIGVYAARALLDGKLTGKPGETFLAGKSGKQTVSKDGVVYLKVATIITKANVVALGF